MKQHLTSFPLRLAFLVLPLIVLLVIVAFGSIALHQSTMREMLVQHNKQAVSGTATSISEQLTQRQAILQALADNPNRDSIPTEITQLFDYGVAIYSLEGEVMGSTPNWSEDKDYTQLVISSDTKTFTPITSTGQNATQVILLATGPQFYLVGVVSLETLGVPAVLASLEISDSITVYLMDESGQILYHKNPSEVGEQGTPPANQSDLIVSKASLAVNDWEIIQEERWQEEISPLMRYSQVAPLILVPGIVLALIVVWYGIRQIVYPLQQLETLATSLDWGNFRAIDEPVGGIQEIQRLQATLTHMVERLQVAQSSMHNYIGAVTRAQEEERLRLAHELHDQTAQALVALNHRIQMLKPFVVEDVEATALINETRSMVLESIDDLRRIVRALRPAYLEELGLVPALQMLVQDLSLDDKIQVNFDKQGTPQRLSAEKEIVIYRIAQEALNNAWQHSQATKVVLTIKFTEEEVEVSVKDNGQGFSVPSHAVDLTRAKQDHFGMMGMYERATLIGAYLKIVSEVGQGTTITVRIPLNVHV